MTPRLAERIHSWFMGVSWLTALGWSSGLIYSLIQSHDPVTTGTCLFGLISTLLPGVTPEQIQAVLMVLGISKRPLPK